MHEEMRASIGTGSVPQFERSGKTPYDLPPKLLEAKEFLAKAVGLGSELAFWRGNSRLGLLRDANEEMRILLAHPRVFAATPDRHVSMRTGLEAMLEAIAKLAEAVPFRTKVGLLRRSLIPCYQEIFILRSLLESAICRLKFSDPDSEPLHRPGELLHADARVQLRQAAGAVAALWDDKEWDLYDYL